MSEYEGYILIHRKLLNDVVWKKSTNEQRVILLVLMIMANHDRGEWEWQGKKFNVQRGQFITSIDSIKRECAGSITTQNIRTALVKFEKLNFLTNEPTKTGRLITIVNYDFYQSTDNFTNKATNKDLTKTSQRPNKDLTPNNNDNNNKNDIKDKTYVHEIDFLWGLYPNKKGKAQAIKKLPALIKKYGVEAIEKAIRCYCDEVEGQDLKYVKHGSTFFNSGILDYIDKKKERSLGYFIDVEDEETGLISRKWIGGA